jgi:rhodanese-related sulfurtransferase
MKKTLLAFIISSLVAVSAFAGKGKYPSISHDELKQAVATNAATIIDVNGSKSFKEGRIPGAIDFAKLKDNLAGALPADKNALIVAYCGSPSCGAYAKAAEAAAKLGYTNVRYYSGGISGWKEAGEATEKG